MTLHVERFTGEDAEWDQFVRAQAGWTHFHLAGWRHVIQRVHDHEMPFLAARGSSGELRGVLPLARVGSSIFGRYLVSMPYVNYGGPLGDVAAVQALARHAARIARDEGGELLELRSRYELPLSFRVSHRKITCVLDLPSDDPDKTWRGLDANVRRRVRRAQKAGITVAFGPEQLDAFYSVFARHMRDLGSPAQPRELFAEIASTFPHDFEVGCAYLGTRPIAAIAGLRWNDEFEVTWASALIEYKELAANMLVYWEFIARSARNGMRRFNFGRCTPGSGTHRFKSQWGARDELLWWYEGTGAPRATTPSPTESSFSWGPRIWKRLPAALATAVGPHIVRYIP